MSRTILNPEYANDLNGLFDGSGSIDSGSITATSITGSTISSLTSLNAIGNINGANLAVVNVAGTGNLTIGGTAVMGGNITGANLSVVGIVASGSATVAGSMTASGNVVGANVSGVSCIGTAYIQGPEVRVAGTTGNGTLTVSADGTILYFNGVQIS
jgi:hypothetical protein